MTAPDHESRSVRVRLAAGAAATTLAALAVLALVTSVQAGTAISGSAATHASPPVSPPPSPPPSPPVSPPVSPPESPPVNPPGIPPGGSPVSPPVSPPVGQPLLVSGHGRFNTNGDGQVTFDVSNDSLTLDRIRGRRIHVEGNVEARDGTGNEATLTGAGSWNGTSGYVFEVSVVDNSPRGRFRDTIEVTIRDSSGATVFTSFGPQKLKQGNITVKPGDPT